MFRADLMLAINNLTDAQIGQIKSALDSPLYNHHNDAVVGRIIRKALDEQKIAGVGK